MTFRPGRSVWKEIILVEVGVSSVEMGGDWGRF
jgi:hypothetical protein